MFLRDSILRSELRRLAKSLALLAENLEQAEDFPTDTASDLCRLIRETAALIADNIGKAPEGQLLLVHTLLVQLAEHLRYPDRSRIEQTPWSIVQATEDFLQAHIRTPCKFIIRPQWNYNYGLIGGFIEAYVKEVESLSKWFPVSDWKKKVEPLLEVPIYCLSFPRVEKMNILAHVNWGHEVGHILASEWLNSKFSNLWKARESGIKKRIRADYLRKIPAGFQAPDSLVKEQVADALKKTMHLAKSALKELISDAVGAHLFGPATLASLAEFSCHKELDVNPIHSSGGYPPWRYRLRMIAKAVVPSIARADKANWSKTLSQYVTWVTGWHDALKPKLDGKTIDAEIKTREAYALVKANWSEIWRQVLRQLPPRVRAPYRLAKRATILEELIDRMDRGIPPNEVGTWPNNHAAPLADIWNAAWACKIAAFQEGREDFDDYLETVFQLTLKAMEASYVQSSFGPDLRKLEDQ